MPPSQSLPEFFIDRSLARRDVAEALRGAGWLVRTHLEVFGDRDQEITDIDASRANLPLTSGYSALVRRLERAPRRAAALRRSVLERAFRGELFPQDPSDEPASVLLDRIRAERAVSQPATGRRRSAVRP